MHNAALFLFIFVDSRIHWVENVLFFSMLGETNIIEDRNDADFTRLQYLIMKIYYIKFRFN